MIKTSEKYKRKIQEGQRDKCTVDVDNSFLILHTTSWRSELQNAKTTRLGTATKWLMSKKPAAVQSLHKLRRLKKASGAYRFHLFSMFSWNQTKVETPILLYLSLLKIYSIKQSLKRAK